ALQPPIVTPDSEDRYERLAHNLVAGNGLSRAVAPPYTPDRFDQPIYPLFLAATEIVAGHNRVAVVLVQLLVELVGVVCIVAAARVGGLSPPAVFATAVFALLCPVLPTVARAIWTETLSTTALAGTCLAWLIVIRTPERRMAWLL